jgi:hypothetical protein
MLYTTGVRSYARAPSIVFNVTQLSAMLSVADRAIALK